MDLAGLAVFELGLQDTVAAIFGAIDLALGAAHHSVFAVEVALVTAFNAGVELTVATDIDYAARQAGLVDPYI